MSTFNASQSALTDFSGTVRLFPLPNLVLFPHVLQPLHVFEDRYRQLLEDALARDRLIAMAMLVPGWEKDYEGRPPIYSMACLGRIATHCRLKGGAYNVLLLGLRRVRLVRELAPRKGFREARVELCEDLSPPGDAQLLAGLQVKLREALVRVLPCVPQAQEQIDQLLAADVPLGMLADMVSYMLDIDLGAKQALLAELSVRRRTELLLGHLEIAAGALQSVAGLHDFPPGFSAN